MRMRRWRWSEFARPHLVFSRFLVYPIGKPPLTIGDASHRSCAWNADTLPHGSPDVPEPQPSFIALFRLAKREALLGAQGDQVIELMYGLSEDPPLLAERVGEAVDFRIAIERLWWYFGARSFCTRRLHSLCKWEHFPSLVWRVFLAQ
jgi:hypothetical protein